MKKAYIIDGLKWLIASVVLLLVFLFMICFLIGNKFFGWLDVIIDEDF